MLWLFYAACMVRVIHNSYTQAIKTVDNHRQHAARQRKVIHMLDKVSTLHSAAWAARLALTLAMMLMGVLCLSLTASPVAAVGTNTKSIDVIKSYAGSLLTPLEFSAALILWSKESNWRTSARNGSHYGICQGRSKYMRDANYKQQVRWCVAYARARYGSIMGALDHWKIKGWH